VKYQITAHRPWHVVSKQGLIVTLLSAEMLNSLEKTWDCRE